MCRCVLRAACSEVFVVLCLVLGVAGGCLLVVVFFCHHCLLFVVCCWLFVVCCCLLIDACSVLVAGRCA